MPRMARVVIPEYPHHVTQRGNRRQRVFFSDADYSKYLSIMRAAIHRSGVSIWAYCLMPNHCHWIVVPKHPDGLRQLFADGHRRYTTIINRREDWRGHLWQERFHSFVMDEAYLIAALRYVELNPVRAGLCESAAAWRWSSARAHLSGIPDGLVSLEPMFERIKDWAAYLNIDDNSADLERLRAHSKTGRPLGSNSFIEALEQSTGRQLRKEKPGRKPK